MSQPTILLIEDNPITRKMMRFALVSGGFEVLEAGDGRTALELAARERIDLVIQDYVLPDMDGLQLLEKLRALPAGRELPVVVITGMVSQLERLRAHSAGPTSFFSKPVEPSRLLELVRAHLSGTPQPLGEGRRVLVVDHKEQSRKLTLMCLQDANYAVEMAASGETALEMARRDPPDAILSDILMPGMDGFQLCREVRREPQLKRVPVVLLSSEYVEAPDQALARALGANTLVPRTAQLREALDALAEALRVGVPPEVAAAGDLGATHADRVQAQLQKQVARNEALLREGAIQAAALSVVRGLAEALARPEDLPGMLADVLVHCLDAAGLSTGLLYLPGPGGGLRLQSQAGLPSATRAAAAECFGHPEVVHAALEGGEPVACSPHATDLPPALREFAARLGHASALIVPFVVQRQRFGALILASDTHDLSDPSWRGFARALGVQFGQTIALGQYLTRGAATEMRYRRLMEKAHDAILIIDEAYIVEANRQAEVLFGRPAADLIGSRYQDFLVLDEREAAEPNHPAPHEVGSHAESRQLLRPDGSRIGVDLAASHVNFGDESMGILILRDVTEREQAAAALRRSEARMTAVLDAALDAVIGMDEAGRVASWNRRAETMFGWRADEAAGRTVAELIVPERLRDAHRRGLERFLGTGESRVIGHRVELSARRRDDSEFPAELTVSAVREGEAFFFSAFVADITQRKRAEQALRDSEERSRMLLDSAAEAIYGVDLAGRCTFANPACARLLGYQSPERLLGREMHSLVHHHRADGTAYPQAECPVYRASRTGEPVHVADEMLWRADGTGFPAEYWSYPIRRDGTMVGAVVTFLDTTERMLAAQWLRESEEQYRLLFETNPHPMWVFDPVSLAFLQVNDAAVRLYGYSRAEFLRMTIEDIRPLEDVPALLEHLRNGTGPTPAVWRHRRRDGSTLEVEVAANPIRFRDRTARLVLATDVSEKKQLEAQLLQAQKMEAVGRLAGGVAHDFNNLLGVITGYAELLDRRLEPAHPGHRQLQEISKAAERAARLTRQLLAFSRKQVLQPEILDLGEVVQEVEKMLARLLGEDIQLITRLPPGLGSVRADRGQLEQVIVNLAVNARDAMPEGGELFLETANVTLDEAYARLHPDVTPGPHVMLAVRDAGQGMDAETQAHIFEPFFTTKPEGKGTGLGLATVFGIVKQSGGHIAVHSEPGVGTTLKLYLPRVDARPLRAQAGQALAQRPGGNETILLVEDAEALRDLLHEILTEAGYRVIDAADAEQALHAVGSGQDPVDLVVTDVVMPRMSGSELVRRLSELRPGLRVIYMSGYTSERIGRDGVLEPGTHFIQKPFNSDDVLRKVRQVLDQTATDT